MTRIVVLVLLTITTCVSAAPTPSPRADEFNKDALRELEQQAWPFGRVEDADIDRLQEFALKRGLDLKAEMARAYADTKVDEDALGRVFIFSRQFNTLDKNARSYGQIIYSSLLNIGEHVGVSAYIKIIDHQPADVQQRIRDFLYYPDWHTHRDQNRKTYNHVYPGLFPKTYHFAHDDPIFAKET